MTNKQSHDDGVLGEDELTWLVRRAEGGFGVVTTCAANVQPNGKSWEGELGIYDDVHVPGLRRIAAELRANGALSLVQIFHGGYRAPSRLTGVQPVSCTGFDIDADGFERPRELSTEEVVALVESFVAAARRAKDAGFDGVELHGAHTYLISQFLSKEYNTRDDRYGGSLENRYRFLSEALRGVRSRCGSDFIVGVRLSPGVPTPHAGISLEEVLEIVPAVVEDGADFIHLSLKHAAGEDATAQNTGAAAIPAVRGRVPDSVAIMACGGITDGVVAEKALGYGADFVAVARTAIGNAQWPKLVRAAKTPVPPPYSEEHLRGEGLSEAFVQYMRRWPGFVVGGEPPKNAS